MWACQRFPPSGTDQPCTGNMLMPKPCNNASDSMRSNSSVMAAGLSVITDKHNLQCNTIHVTLSVLCMVYWVGVQCTRLVCKHTRLVHSVSDWCAVWWQEAHQKPIWALLTAVSYLSRLRWPPLCCDSEMGSYKQDVFQGGSAVLIGHPIHRAIN